MIFLRRTIARLLLLATVLFLSGCTITMRVHTKNKPADDSAPYFMLNSLPDIGEYVDDTIYQRRYSQVQDMLIPGEDYGKLIPFVGNLRDFHLVDYSTGDWLDETIGITKYGLMNLQGEIIVDALYDSFEITPTKNNDYLISLFQFTEDDGISKQFLCNSDGSWAMEIKDGLSCSLGAWSDGYLIITDHSQIDYRTGSGGPWVAFCDLEGNTIFHFNNCNANSSDGFCDGYMMIDIFSNYTAYEYQSVFIDLNGKIAFPDIHPLSNFEDGKAPAKNKEGLCGLFSSDGKWVITPKYQDVYLSGNYYIASNGYDYDIYDLLGNYLTTISGHIAYGQSLSTYGNNIYLEYSYEDNTQGYVTRYTNALTNQVISCRETGAPVTDHISETEYFYCNNGAVTYIVDNTGNTTATLDGVGDIHLLGEDHFAFVQGNWDDASQPYSVYDLQTFQWLWTQTISNTGTSTNYWQQGNYIIRTHSNDPFMFNQTTQDLLDIKTGQPIFEGLKNISCITVGENIYLGCADDIYTYFYNTDLTLLMKIRNTTTD